MACGRMGAGYRVITGSGRGRQLPAVSRGPPLSGFLQSGLPERSALPERFWGIAPSAPSDPSDRTDSPVRVIGRTLTLPGSTRPRTGANGLAGGAVQPASRQLVGAFRRRLYDLRREVGQGAGELAQCPAHRDAEHTLAAAQQVDDLFG